MASDSCDPLKLGANALCSFPSRPCTPASLSLSRCPLQRSPQQFGAASHVGSQGERFVAAFPYLPGPLAQALVFLEDLAAIVSCLHRVAAENDLCDDDVGFKRTTSLDIRCRLCLSFTPMTPFCLNFRSNENSCASTSASWISGTH